MIFRQGESDMKVILFGATGMVGQGVLRECLADPDVDRVLSIGRRECGTKDGKLTEILHKDFTGFSSIERDLSGYDACFFCLGVSSAGMKEPDYRHVTYDFALAAGRVLARQNPGMTFVYVSGAGTDSSERGRMMWARVKGKTENDLLKLPFKAAFMFRPAFIQPLHGVQPTAAWTRVFYTVTGPLLPAANRLLPQFVTTTEQIGRAMLNVAKHGAPARVLENRQIVELGSGRARD